MENQGLEFYLESAILFECLEQENREAFLFALINGSEIKIRDVVDKESYELYKVHVALIDSARTSKGIGIYFTGTLSLVNKEEEPVQCRGVFMFDGKSGYVIPQVCQS